MVSENIAKLLNEQVNHEFYSAYLYLAMSAYLAENGYAGIANWYFVQYREETEHALYIFKYLESEGARVVFSAVPSPETDFKGVQDILQKTLNHERKVTDLINSIAKAALNESDFRTLEFMSWFIKEQAEEERNCNDNLAKAEICGRERLYILDESLGARVYTPSQNPPIVI
ncbi:MAG: ferritin [bacterium]|nr:ferritin [bacterium]